MQLFYELDLNKVTDQQPATLQKNYFPNVFSRIFKLLKQLI